MHSWVTTFGLWLVQHRAWNQELDYHWQCWSGISGMGCSGSREANSIYEAKKHSIPLPTGNVMLLQDVARACKQCGKSAKQSWCSRNYKRHHVIYQGSRKAYGISHPSVPENILQQIIKQFDCKKLKDNKAVRSSQYLSCQIKSCQTNSTCFSDRLTVPTGWEKSANIRMLILNTAFNVLQMTFSQANYRN